MFSSGWNRGCHTLLCISGHLKGSPKPGTVQPLCFLEAITSPGNLDTNVKIEEVKQYGVEINATAQRNVTREEMSKTACCQRNAHRASQGCGRPPYISRLAVTPDNLPRIVYVIMKAQHQCFAGIAGCCAISESQMAPSPTVVYDGFKYQPFSLCGFRIEGSKDSGDFHGAVGVFHWAPRYDANVQRSR